MDEVITQLLTYVKGILKYRWYAVAVAWVVSLAGWIVVYKLPDDYQASARIYVDTQSILKPLMSGMTTTPNVEQQVNIMSRTLISRPNVERVMRMVDLDIKAKTAKEHDELINELMSKIQIISAGRDNLFTISYNNDKPKLAKDVVQSLLTIFVEGGLGDNKKDSASAVRFIDEQIQSYEEKLVAAETALKNFKQKNMGMMPNQGGDYLSKLSQAFDILNQSKLELREAEQAREAIKAQISDDEPSLMAQQAPEASYNPEIDARIQTLTKNLDSLRLNFTEQHPDIVSTKRLIAQLEERKKEEAKLNKHRSDPGKNYSPMLQQLNISLTEADARVASMRARVAEYSNRYNNLKSMSNAVPEVEAELTRLNRDYEVNKGNYDRLVERRESAKMSGEMSSTTDLVSFKIIDPPTVPQLPAGPNRPRLFSLIFLGSLVAGVGVAFLLSQIRPTFHNQNALRDLAERPILGSVAMIWTDQEKKNRRKRMYAFGISLFFLLSIYITLMIVTTQNNRLF